MRASRFLSRLIHSEFDLSPSINCLHDSIFRFGLNGKACVLRAICELSESRGLPYNGLLGKALETVFL